MDNVTLATPAYLSFPLFDMEKVEVFKGPQATLYGKSTTAGTINFTTRKPSRTFDAYSQLRYGRFNDLNIESAVGGGITDELSGRAAVYIH